METKKSNLVWTVIACIIALFFGIWLQHNQGDFFKSKSPTLVSGTLLPESKPLNAFQLIDDQNHIFNNSNLKNHWSLVFFGFTHCPELCPTTLATLNQAYQTLIKSHQNPLPQIVFISVDPKRDTPKQIKKYLSGFNLQFIGATGNKQQIDALTQQLNVMYMKAIQKGEPPEGYTIDHSGTVLLINPQGELQAVFSTPHNAENLAKDTANIINQRANN